MGDKKEFNIGDTFMTWEVIKCVDPKKYRFLCRCSCCGEERIFYKYNLLSGAYAPCKKCGHTKVDNVSLIRKHWNTELNGAIFTGPEDFDLNSSYWFICNKGHNFKSNIKDFSLSKCLNCRSKNWDAPYKIEAFEYATKLFNAVFYNVDVNGYILIVDEIRFAMFITEDNRFSSYRNYYSSEEDFIKDMTTLKEIESGFKELGYRFDIVKIKKTLEENIDIFKGVMLSLSSVKTTGRFDF